MSRIHTASISFTKSTRQSQLVWDSFIRTVWTKVRMHSREFCGIRRDDCHCKSQIARTETPVTSMLHPRHAGIEHRTDWCDQASQDPEILAALHQPISPVRGYSTFFWVYFGYISPRVFLILGKHLHQGILETKLGWDQINFWGQHPQMLETTKGGSHTFVATWAIVAKMELNSKLNVCRVLTARAPSRLANITCKFWQGEVSPGITAKSVVHWSGLQYMYMYT